MKERLLRLGRGPLWDPCPLAYRDDDFVRGALWPAWPSDEQLMTLRRLESLAFFMEWAHEAALWFIDGPRPQQGEGPQ